MATSSVSTGGEVGGYIKCEHWRRSGATSSVSSGGEVGGYIKCE